MPLRCLLLLGKPSTLPTTARQGCLIISLAGNEVSGCQELESRFFVLSVKKRVIGTFFFAYRLIENLLMT